MPHRGAWRPLGIGSLFVALFFGAEAGGHVRGRGLAADRASIVVAGREPDAGERDLERDLPGRLDRLASDGADLVAASELLDELDCRLLGEVIDVLVVDLGG